MYTNFNFIVENCSVLSELSKTCSTFFYGFGSGFIACHGILISFWSGWGITHQEEMSNSKVSELEKEDVFYVQFPEKIDTARLHRQYFFLERISRIGWEPYRITWVKDQIVQRIKLIRNYLKEFPDDAEVKKLLDMFSSIP